MSCKKEMRIPNSIIIRCNKYNLDINLKFSLLAETGYMKINGTCRFVEEMSLAPGCSKLG